MAAAGRQRKTVRCAVGAATLGLAAAALLAPVAAAAHDIPNITDREFKFGVLVHDAHFLGGKEGGVDLNPELILESPIDSGWAARLPWYVRWTVQPRPTIGGEINTSGFTNQYYFGATWTWQLASNLLHPGDGLTAGIFFGPGFNDGFTVSPVPNRKSLGSHVLFREALEIGYRITPTIEISGFIDHVSNAGFARYNQSLNDVGGRLGFRF